MRRRESGGGEPAAGRDEVAETHARVRTDDGVTLHLEREPAPPGRESAPAVVLVHGFANDLRALGPERAALARRSAVLLYDQRGHGRSGARADPRSRRGRTTIEQFGADLERVLTSGVPAGPVVLVGHSMGGMAVLALARSAPGLFRGPGARVVGVGLLSTSPGKLSEVTLGLPSALARMLHRTAPGLLELASRSSAVRLLERTRRATTALTYRLTRQYAFGADVPPGLVELVADMVAETPVTTLAEVFPAFRAHDQFAALPVLADLPALVLVGERDLLTPPDHSRAIAEQLPRAELVVVPGAGHMVPLEAPEAVTAALLRLLERAEAGTRE